VSTIGPRNPLPMHLGGNPSPTEVVWRALRKCLGVTVGGRETAGPIGGIEDSWRLAKARAIARTLQLDELAALQAFPDRATVHLSVYEEELLVDQAATDHERRASIAAAYTAQSDGVASHIRDVLRRVSTDIDIVVTPADVGTVGQFGKVLDSRPTPAWTLAGAAWPAYSDHCVCVVSWAGSPTTEQRNQVAELLNAMLPAWVDWVILRDDDGGFYCSHSYLGVDAL